MNQGFRKKSLPGRAETLTEGMREEKGDGQ